jgi:hypothetical protein
MLKGVITYEKAKCVAVIAQRKREMKVYNIRFLYYK